MSKEPELKAREKVVVRMTREGAVEENLTAGTEQRVSKRLEDAELVKHKQSSHPRRVYIFRLPFSDDNCFLSTQASFQSYPDTPANQN